MQLQNVHFEMEIKGGGNNIENNKRENKRRIPPKIWIEKWSYKWTEKCWNEIWPFMERSFRPEKTNLTWPNLTAQPPIFHPLTFPGSPSGPSPIRHYSPLFSRLLLSIVFPHSEIKILKSFSIHSFCTVVAQYNGSKRTTIVQKNLFLFILTFTIKVNFVVDALLTSMQ
jgi:hypothetical protein